MSRIAVVRRMGLAGVALALGAAAGYLAAQVRQVEPGLAAKVEWPPCRHRADSFLQCPDSVQALDVQEMQLTVRTSEGATHSVTVTGDYDTIFLNDASLETFAFPHYEKTKGKREADEMRRKLKERPRK